MCQPRKRLLHQRGNLPQLRFVYGKLDTRYTIGVSECSNDIFFIDRWNDTGKSNNDGNGWPGTQNLPKRGPIRAKKLEIETAWECEYDLSPPSAYMDQQVPCPDAKREVIGLVVTLLAPIKYFKQDVVRENADRCRVSLPFIWDHRVSTVDTGILETVPCAPKVSSFS